MDFIPADDDWAFPVAPEAVDPSKPICGKCKKRNRTGRGRWCRPCANAYSRAYREHREVLSEEQKHKDRVRTIARSAYLRGEIVKRPCEACGDKDSQMHHADYSKPLDVEWLCRPCHLQVHASSPA